MSKLGEWFGIDEPVHLIGHGMGGLVARAFIGMFVSFIQTQEIFGQKKIRTFDRDEVVRTFVSIFLTGIKQQ